MYIHNTILLIIYTNKWINIYKYIKRNLNKICLKMASREIMQRLGGDLHPLSSTALKWMQPILKFLSSNLLTKSRKKQVNGSQLKESLNAWDVLVLSNCLCENLIAEYAEKFTATSVVRRKFLRQKHQLMLKKYDHNDRRQFVKGCVMHAMLK